ncbi:hypothetical protein N7478_008934 [Penicillium angulare]|uniref:uncharacterized protein n=1 Tax=Penicillium angulare TaxID=116970 RepID=UPI002540CD5D|nr:uncharacterized protein N7478_008934 [Penicillium angulare]KAJ5273809.1 hypothetical protein N7478_008934 [Penicillium angulare]
MSELWLDTTTGVIEITATNSTRCTDNPDASCSTGYFDIDASSTYKFISNDPTDEADFPVDFGSDNVTISGLALSSVDLVVNMGTDLNEFLGIGYIVSDKLDAPASILQALLDQGHIKSAAYSLWVDEPTGTTGTILFGGVDTTKYTGELYTMSVPAVNGTRYLPTVLMTKVTVQTSSVSPGNSSTLPTYMVLSSTSPQTVLPTETVEQVFKDLNITWDEEYQVGMIDCGASEKDYSITFTFGDFSIKAPVSDFIATGNSDRCQFNFVPSLGGTPILASDFLRRAYVVYDLSNHEISMAQRDFDAEGENILEIGSGANPISSAISVSDTASVTVPTAVVNPSGATVLPTKFTSSVSSAHSTSTSKDVAVVPTGCPNNPSLLAGVIGAGLWMAL